MILNPVHALLQAYGNASLVSSEDIGRALARQVWTEGESQELPNAVVQEALTCWLPEDSGDRTLPERRIRDAFYTEMALLRHSEPSLLKQYEPEEQYTVRHSTTERFNGGNPFTHYRATLVDYLDDEVAEGMARTKRGALQNLRTELTRQYKTRTDVVLAAIEKETP